MSDGDRIDSVEFDPTSIEDQFEDDDRYYNYVFDVIDGIPLLNLCDACFIFARDIFRRGSGIPDCIPGIDKALLNNAVGTITDEEEIELLKPFQKWLVEKISLSIEKGEIETKILARHLSGNIDTSHTFIDDDALMRWLSCRGLETFDNFYEFYGNFDPIELSERIVHSVLYLSKLLTESLYTPNFEMPLNDDGNQDNLRVENARLRARIKELQGKLTQRKPHGGEERFAKNREEVLGAAVAVLAKFPGQCKNSLDKFEATKIAQLIDDKGKLFWPETGNPPLSRDKMERVISKWLKAIGE
jgi:hypothetical protein